MSDAPRRLTPARGAIVVVADRRGRYTGKPRPALVVQSLDFAATGSLVVCLLTTTELDAPWLRVPLPADTSTNLEKSSWVMVDKLTAIDRRQVAQVIGRADEATMAAVSRGLIRLLALGSQRRGRIDPD